MAVFIINLYFIERNDESYSEFLDTDIELPTSTILDVNFMATHKLSMGVICYQGLERDFESYPLCN
jgi:hypothetical protein